MNIILDNGHGINKSGKRSPNGMIASANECLLREFEFNRAIVRGIADSLSLLNIDHTVLVPEVEDVSLKERCRRANEIYAKDKDSFLVSVHANGGGGTGWEVYTYVGQSESDVIADVFGKEAEKLFPEFRMRFDSRDGDLDKESHFYILKHTHCPAILTENFFMDTEKDLRFISSTEGRKRIINHHVKAIIEYIKL